MCYYFFCEVILMLIYLQIIESDADRDKFEQLYYYYRDYMFHIANRIVKNEYDAEDAVHSAFESIAKNIGKLGNVECSKTRAYIVIIVEHKSIDIIRERKRFSEEDPDVTFSRIGKDFLPDGSLAQSLNKLPFSYREALILRFYIGYSASEAASVMGVTYENMRKILARARKALEKILEREDEKIKR